MPSFPKNRPLNSLPISGSEDRQPEELLQTMEAQGIQRSVVFGFPWEKKEHSADNNDYILESVQKHPDKLIGFCCFHLSPSGSGRSETMPRRSVLPGSGAGSL